MVINKEYAIDKIQNIGFDIIKCNYRDASEANDSVEAYRNKKFHSWYYSILNSKKRKMMASIDEIEEGILQFNWSSILAFPVVTLIS